MTVKVRPAEVSSGDVLKHTWEIKFGPYAFVARVAGGRAEFLFSGEVEPFGYIRPGSARAGGIWLTNDCIGEYEQVSDAQSLVTPIAHGRRMADQAEEIDPVTFLLREAVRRLR